MARPRKEGLEQVAVGSKGNSKGIDVIEALLAEVPRHSVWAQAEREKWQALFKHASDYVYQEPTPPPAA